MAKGYPTSIWMSDERKKKLMILKEQLGLKSWGMTMAQAIDLLWEQRNNGRVQEKAENESIVIDAKINETLTGDLVGSYKKEQKKLKSIDEAEEAGMPKELADKLRDETKRNYAASREAIMREFRRQKKGTKEWYMDRIKEAGKNLVGAPVHHSNQQQRPKFLTFYRMKCKCGWKWDTLDPNENNICPECGSAVKPHHTWKRDIHPIPKEQ